MLPEIDARVARTKLSCCIWATAPACARSPAGAACSSDGIHRRRRSADGNALQQLDPGVVLYLIGHLGMDTRDRKADYQESGLLGVSGISSDMRTLLASQEAGAKAAIDLFVYRIGRELGSLAAALADWTPSCSLPASAKTAGITRARLQRRRVARRRHRFRGKRRGARYDAD